MSETAEASSEADNSDIAEALQAADAPETADNPNADLTAPEDTDSDADAHADAGAGADADADADTAAPQHTDTPEAVADPDTTEPTDATYATDTKDMTAREDVAPGDHGYPMARDLARRHPHRHRRQRPPVSKLAIVALVTGILPAAPVALVTGTAALVGIRRSGRRGHGMAVAALFLATAWIIIGGAVGTVAVLTHGFRKPVKTIYHESAVFSLRPGECVDIPNGGQPSVVPCTVPHDAEVFGTFPLTDSAWPGTTAVQQQASAGCGTLLAGYLNPQLAISLTQTYVYPNQVDWTAGTRTVVCEVRAVTGQLSESVRGGTATP